MNTLTDSMKTLIATLMAVCVFFSGMSSMMTEFNLSSISSMILGNGNQQWALTIGLMLLAMGIGGFTQRLINDNNLILKFMLVEILLSLMGSFTPLGMYAAYAYIPNHFSILHYISIFNIGFLVGFEIPLTIRIIEHYKPQLSNNLGFIFGSEYVGAFIGSLLFTSYILGIIAFTDASFMISGLNLFVTFITFIIFTVKINNKLDKAERVNTPLVGTLLLCAISGLIYGATHISEWSIHIEQKLYKDPIVETFTSKYQRIVITKDFTTSEYRMYINGNTQWAQFDEKWYHELLVHPVMSFTKKHDKVLVLGGGDGLAVRELKKYSDIETITLVDLDRQMIEYSQNSPIMRKINESSFDDVKIVNSKGVTSGDKTFLYSVEREPNKFETIATLNAVFVDANIFLNDVSGTFDIVIIDLPDPSTPELSKLYSREFYMNLKRRMSDDAMVVIQSTSPIHAKESFLMIGRTLASAGFNVAPYHRNIPSFGEWGWWVGWKSNKPKDMLTDLSPYTIDVPTSYLDDPTMGASFVFGKGMLKGKSKEINSWMKPVLVNTYNNGW